MADCDKDRTSTRRRSTTGISALLLATTSVLGLGAAIAFFPAETAFADATVECNVNGGDDSTECGVNSVTSTDRSTAIGNAADATGTQGTAVGHIAKATGVESTAIGQDAEASALRSVAVGEDSEATAVRSLAVGNIASATGAESIAIGALSDATGVNSVAIGGDGTDGGTQGCYRIRQQLGCFRRRFRCQWRRCDCYRRGRRRRPLSAPLLAGLPSRAPAKLSPSARTVMPHLQPQLLLAPTRRQQA